MEKKKETKQKGNRFAYDSNQGLSIVSKGKENDKKDDTTTKK